MARLRFTAKDISDILVDKHEDFELTEEKTYADNNFVVLLMIHKKSGQNWAVDFRRFGDDVIEGSLSLPYRLRDV